MRGPFWSVVFAIHAIANLVMVAVADGRAEAVIHAVLAACSAMVVGIDETERRMGG